MDGRRAPTIMVYFTRTGTTLLRNGTGTTAMGGTAPMQWHARHGYATMCLHTVAPHAARTRRGWDVHCCFCCCCSRLFLRLPTSLGEVAVTFPTVFLVYAGSKGTAETDRPPKLEPTELRRPRPPRRDGRRSKSFGRPATQNYLMQERRFSFLVLWNCTRKGWHGISTLGPKATQFLFSFQRSPVSIVEIWQQQHCMFTSRFFAHNFDADED